jgi:protein TonB
VVTKAGEISDVQVVHGMDGYPFSDEEAKRLVSNMPRWKPGKNSGHAVNVRFTLPIRFQ